MQIKSFLIAKQLRHFIRVSALLLWGAVGYLQLSPQSASAETGRGSVVLMKPTDLPAAAQVSGEDMFLYYGNAKTYLYVEQDHGQHLLILDVTDPGRVRFVGALPIPAHGTYDFVETLENNAVLVRFHDDNGGRPLWGRLRLNRPASPTLTTWSQDSGEIIDPSTNRIYAANSASLALRGSTDLYEIVDGAAAEPHEIATIHGVKRVLADGMRGDTYYLAKDGLWILRNLSVERSFEDQQLPRN
jgi:hypothetical protein